MESKNVSFKDSEEVLSRIIRYGRLTGMVWPKTKYEISITMIMMTWNSLLTLQLLYSISKYAGDYDSIAMIVFHALAIGCSPIATVLFLPRARRSMAHLLEGASYSYDYGGKVMSSIQEESRMNKNKYIVNTARMLPVMNLIMTLNQVATSLVDKFIFGTKYLSLTPIWYPTFLDRENFWINLCTYLSQVLNMFYCGGTIFGGMAIVYTVYSHVTSELLLFSKALGLIEKRAKEIFKNDEKQLDVAYKEAIRSCAQHHTLILGYFDKVQPAMENIYGLYYGVGLVFLLCAGFAISSESQLLKLKFAVILTLLLTCLFFLSWCAEDVAATGVAANEAVYDVDFLSLPVGSRSTLRILQVGSQRPLVMRTFLGQAIHLEGYMELLKAAYSYFNMVLVATRGEM